MKTKYCIIPMFISVGIFFCGLAYAESGYDGRMGQTMDVHIQANNPVADMVAFNVQNYMIGELTKSDRSANQLWLRYAQPFSLADTNWLMRASLPVNTYPTRLNKDETGIGDFNVLAGLLLDTDEPGLSLALGPQITLPTASDDVLGSEKWSAGLANVLFDARNNQLQWGYMLTWQHSFAGDSDRADVNEGMFQPFVFYQLGGGTYLRSAPICRYNFEDETYTIPIGVGVGQVVKKDYMMFNFFIEPQVSIIDDGAGWPEWQIVFAVNMQLVDP